MYERPLRASCSSSHPYLRARPDLENNAAEANISQPARAGKLARKPRNCEENYKYLPSFSIARYFLSSRLARRTNQAPVFRN